MNRLLVLAWHNVEGTWCFPSRRGSGRAGLERQLRALKRLFTVVPLEPTLRQLAAGEPLPPRAVALTFDDGYRDNLELAAPLLRELDLPATFFLVPGLLSRETEPWWEVVSWAVACGTTESIDWEGAHLVLADEHERTVTLRLVTEALKRRPAAARERALAELVERLRPEGARPRFGGFLDWSGAAALVRAGFDVGSHTYSHVILGEETFEHQQRELLQSRRALEHGLDVSVSLLAYPNGSQVDYGPETIEAVVETGYTNALTTQNGWNTPDSPPCELRRVVLYPERGLQGLAALAPAARRAGGLIKRAGRSTSRGLRRVAS